MRTTSATPRVDGETRLNRSKAAAVRERGQRLSSINNETHGCVRPLAGYWTLLGDLGAVCLMRTGRTGRLSAVLIRCPRYRHRSAYRPATGWVDSADADQWCQEVQQLMLARETRPDH